MFFSQRIRSIGSGDRVLEIGPGATPFVRADEFLEYDFGSDDEAIRQRGEVQAVPEFGERKVSRYKGARFPFRDGEFDYVIASHVIEHVEDPRAFMAEVFRVGRGRGYIEFPLPPYEYLYDFDVHRHLVWWDREANELKFVPKASLDLGSYRPITSQLARSLELGWDDVVASNLDYFFCGFEFDAPFNIRPEVDLGNFQHRFTQDGRSLGRRLGRKLASLMG